MAERLMHAMADCALHTRIRIRAYEIYEARGGTEGHALEDWLQAEREVMSCPAVYS
jgi:hypothetical protein